ncbi:uncharacterized protein JCM15063_005426 [Sporobolomyces koalae]|uniref:uncharacterized protein n=1 Tax=Sporobolomyces koalae TaxID=500713 RepID=UPI003170BFDA
MDGALAPGLRRSSRKRKIRERDRPAIVEPIPDRSVSGSASPSYFACTLPSKAPPSLEVWLSSPAPNLDVVEEEHWEPEEEESVSGPALKKLLLANLRQRWSDQGTPATTGAAALSFRKWVLWNAWRLETMQLESNSDQLPYEHVTQDECDFFSSSLSTAGEDDAQLGSNCYTASHDDDFSARETGGAGCVFTMTGQMIDLSLPEQPPPSTPSYTYLNLALRNSAEGVQKPRRPGLTRSSTAAPLTLSTLPPLPPASSEAVTTGRVSCLG